VRRRPADRARRALAFKRLLQWLGPWADAAAAPSGVSLRVESVTRAAGEAQLRSFVYTPDDVKPIGALLVAHGLHPKGPEDPRLDRFLRILAHAGFLVAAPALPDYLQLRCDSRAADDFARAFDAFVTYPDCPVAAPGVLSISFGSYPALRLLCDVERSRRVSGGVIFGGYGDPVATLRYTIGQRPPDAPAPDPLSVPAVAINLVPELPLPAALREQVTTAWLDFARATWGFPHLREPAAHAPIAYEIAGRLPPEARELFLRGCGLTADSQAFFLSALTHADRLQSIDPRPHLRHLRRPLHLMHGRDDDVIPASELQTLTAACPAGAPVHAYLTGLYAHTGTKLSLRALPALAHEATTLTRMLGAVVNVATLGA
jgi:hypothetical protein